MSYIQETLDKSLENFIMEVKLFSKENQVSEEHLNERKPITDELISLISDVGSFNKDNYNSVMYILKEELENGTSQIEGVDIKSMIDYSFEEISEWYYSKDNETIIDEMLSSLDYMRDQIHRLG